MLEINGNLFAEGSGLSNIGIFQKAVMNVRGYYLAKLGRKFKQDIGLYVDNATSGSGYTPIITRVLNQVLVIKLCISSDSSEAQIAYQFAHEYMHYIFYCKYGLEKPLADNREETICSAASLIVLRDLYPTFFIAFDNYTRALSDNAYREGAYLAENVNYDINILANMI